ncbi:MAG TPA: hypothetical protein VF092_25280 [Longimicrobium sp.]
MHVYQAAFRAASALVRAAGYRIRGAVGGHHYATFYAAGALGDDDLERAADALQNVRGGRHAALYGDDEELEPEDLEAAREHVARLLALVHSALVAQRPSLAGQLHPP